MQLVVEGLPTLGIGLGFRPQFKAEVFLNRDAIEFLEITSDHYIDSPPKKLEELQLLAEHFPLIPHSLELSLGSAEGIDEGYLSKLADIVSIAHPAWFSDHICFTRSGGVNIGHLAPVPFTEEALGAFVRNVDKVKKRIDVPLILENITYNIDYPWNEMSEAAFIRRLLEETDCGLLLDVANLYINSVNRGVDWRDVVNELPLDRVVQLHFVGAHRHADRLIDAHADTTDDEIWNVFREVAVRCNIKGAILERDENFPGFSEVVAELKTARELLNAEGYVLS
ncbi:MAG: DUF692 domain-containing protein [bacterium]|nr:DUF692 domain-containing protein [bacterium]